MSLQNDLGKALEKFINTELIPKIKLEIEGYDINASRRLNQSLRPDRLELRGNTIIINMLGEFYWKFINYGVNGIEESHNAPDWSNEPTSNDISFHQSIMEWFEDKGGISKPEQFPTWESFAWAVRHNILKKGKEARPFVDDGMKNINYSLLTSDLIRIFAKSIRDGNRNSN